MSKPRKDGRRTKTRVVNGRRFYGYGRTDRDAREDLERKIRKAEEENAAGADLTFSQLYDKFIEDKEIQGKITSSTFYTYDTRFKRILKRVPKFCKRKIGEITRSDVKAVRKNLALSEYCYCKSKKLYRRYDPQTVNADLDFIKTLFSYAMDEEWIVQNPARKIEKVYDENKIPAIENIHRSLCEEDLKLFFEYAEGSHYRDLMYFCVYTGVRISEGLALSWADIDLVSKSACISKTVKHDRCAGFIIGKTKNKKSREIPLQAEVIRMLKCRLAKAKQDALLMGRPFSLNDFVFPNTLGSYGNENCVLSSVRFILKKIRRDYEKGLIDRCVDHFSTHAFRDTYATEQHAQGADLLTISKAIGHSDVETTAKRYIHVKEEKKHEELTHLQLNIAAEG